MSWLKDMLAAVFGALFSSIVAGLRQRREDQEKKDLGAAEQQIDQLEKNADAVADHSKIRADVGRLSDDDLDSELQSWGPDRKAKGKD